VRGISRKMLVIIQSPSLECRLVSAVCVDEMLMSECYMWRHHACRSVTTDPRTTTTRLESSQLGVLFKTVYSQGMLD